MNPDLGGAAPPPIFCSEFIPSGDMERSGRKRSCRSGCGLSGVVRKKPPWLGLG